jgi:rhomboid protease GluP
MFILNADSFKSAKITVYLCLFNIIFYLVFFLNPNFEIYLLLVQINYNVLERLELWRLITSIFLHGDLIHLISNLIGLVLFGTFVENIVSKIEYIVIYLLSGIVGNIMSLFLLPPYVISLGASGAIYGLIGAAVMLIILERNKSQLLITVIYLIYFVITSFSPGINYASHIFGLILGLILGYAFIRNKIPKKDTYY